jgi:uncharacterized membrane protein HdeD (DUF308 family)
MAVFAIIVSQSGRRRISDPVGVLLTRKWWVLTLRGFLGVLLGITLILLPNVAIASLVLLCATYMLADGVLVIMIGLQVRRDKRWNLLILKGVVDIAAGAIALLWPAMSEVVLVRLLSAWAVFSGSLIVAAALLGVELGRRWLVTGGGVSVVWGVLLFLAPLAGAVVLTLWLGAYLLAFGVVVLALALHLRERRSTLVGPPTAITGS